MIDDVPRTILDIADRPHRAQICWPKDYDYRGEWRVVSTDAWGYLLDQNYLELYFRYKGQLYAGIAICTAQSWHRTGQTTEFIGVGEPIDLSWSE